MTGNGGWSFSRCSNLGISAADAPDLSKTWDLSGTFKETTFVEVDSLASWPVGHITKMSSLFERNTKFNGDSIAAWDVSSCTYFDTMFDSCNAFNVDISAWDMSKAQRLYRMFRGTHFNQPIGNWDVCNKPCLLTSCFSLFNLVRTFQYPVM